MYVSFKNVVAVCLCWYANSRLCESVCFRFPNSWKPLNELPDQVTEIPLVKPHVYQVTQLDTTVKGLLERWGEEANMPVVYDYTLDFTLYKKVSTVRNINLDNALSELSKLYEDKGMVFYIQNGVIMAHKKMGVAVKKQRKEKA